MRLRGGNNIHSETFAVLLYHDSLAFMKWHDLDAG